MPGSMAGCAQANIKASRWSGINGRFAVSASSSAMSWRWGIAAAPPRRRRTASTARRRATVTSQPSGLSGMPPASQSVRAAAKASDSASSAASTSPVRAARKATSLP
jgi:hypothetical protein